MPNTAETRAVDSKQPPISRLGVGANIICPKCFHRTMDGPRCVRCEGTLEMVSFDDEGNAELDGRALKEQVKQERYQRLRRRSAHKQRRDEKRKARGERNPLYDKIFAAALGFGALALVLGGVTLLGSLIR